MIIEKRKKRIIFATTASWVIKESKIITIESQKEHYCQGKLMTTIFFLSHLFKKKKWNYGLFLCNRLKELQIGMIIFIFLFELAFCEIICSLVVWSSFVFVWIIFVVNLVFFFLLVYGARDYVWETIIIFGIMLHLQHFKTNLKHYT